MGTIVVAFGGNALQSPEKGAKGSRDSLIGAANAIADIVEAGHRLVVTHGNGPQVGYGLIRNVWAPFEVPRLAMATLVAQSQGELGTLLIVALSDALRDRGLAVPVVSLVTHAVVDPDDASFLDPTKPVGPVLHDPDEVAELSKKTGLSVMKERGGYRLAVPSPVPQKVLESDAVNALLDRGMVVIAGGGGGIPVVYDESAHLTAVTGVVDKDRTSALLAAALRADSLIFLTDVDGVYRDYGTPHMALIAEGTWRDFDAMVHDPEETGVGSMKPKMAAACGFVQATHNPAAIGKLQDAAKVVAGRAGTRIVWGAEEERQRVN